MTLIIGGAYQGKLAWALNNLAPCGCTVFSCNEDSTNIDLASHVIDKLHLYLLALIKEGHDPLTGIDDLLDNLRGKVVIIEDITCGVVPVDAQMRVWREAVGRAMGLAASRADIVVRVFCSIGVRIK